MSRSRREYSLRRQRRAATLRSGSEPMRSVTSRSKERTSPGLDVIDLKPSLSVEAQSGKSTPGHRSSASSSDRFGPDTTPASTRLSPVVGARRAAVARAHERHDPLGCGAAARLAAGARDGDRQRLPHRRSPRSRFCGARRFGMVHDDWRDDHRTVGSEHRELLAFTGEPMTLQCPHCGEAATHERRDVLGLFVICPTCERHFPWSGAKSPSPTHPAPDLFEGDV